ncbi:MAG TPA: TlpA disulfide reductase family protein [Pyrinomonadaceae bacterium]|nr:TlpA disulfide reductase family protein [Pyrinomonadaceae bacterium]
MKEKPLTVYRLPLAALLLLVAFVPAFAQEAKPGPADEPGFRLKGIDGKFYDLSEMRGEVVLVSFGATWCAPCVWELQALEELRQEYARKPVRFLWVSIEGKGQTPDGVLRHYAKSFKVSFPVLRDPEWKTFSRFNERGRVPLVVLFDRQGRFSPPAHRGMSTDPIVFKQRMRGLIDALLRGGEGDGAKESSAGANTRE